MLGCQGSQSCIKHTWKHWQPVLCQGGQSCTNHLKTLTAHIYHHGVWQVSQLICSGNQPCTPLSERVKQREMKLKTNVVIPILWCFSSTNCCPSLLIHSSLYFLAHDKCMWLEQLHQRSLFCIKCAVYLWPLIKQTSDVAHRANGL